MRVLRKGDVFVGKSYADMVNKAIGTNFHCWFKCSVELSVFNCSGVIAWFVFMDGSEHGYEDGWKWVNKLSLDGTEIDEYNISSSKAELKTRRREEGYFPYRLAFQLDPYGNGDKFCCRFIGVFRFKSFIRKDASAQTYEKILDVFKLGGKGENGAYLNKKEDLFPKSGKYLLPIKELGFSKGTYDILRGFVKNAGELLELATMVENPLSNEIYEKVAECFQDEEYI